MKKLLISAIIILGFSTTVYAGVIKPLFVSVNKTETVFVSSREMSDLNVVKFIDGNVTCYTSVNKINGLVANTSISCVK